MYSENLLQFAFLNKTNTDLEVSQVQEQKHGDKSVKPSIPPAQFGKILCKQHQQTQLYLSDLTLQPIFQFEYMGKRVEVNMNKLGRRKPIAVNSQQQLFVQVDCKDNMKVIEVSTQMSKHLNIMQIAKSSNNLDVK